MQLYFAPLVLEFKLKLDQFDVFFKCPGLFIYWRV